MTTLIDFYKIGIDFYHKQNVYTTILTDFDRRGSSTHTPPNSSDDDPRLLRSQRRWLYTEDEASVAVVATSDLQRWGTVGSSDRFRFLLKPWLLRPLFSTTISQVRALVFTRNGEN
ncbi:PAS domain-containing protein [Sesbania bispinosa]|nr:PAS domain-containing protein [Sesbania bispinosa]